MNDFKVAYRNALKDKGISFLNILGLSVGVASALILLLWASHECSFDRFFKNKENIYRLNFSGELNGVYNKVCSSPQGAGPEALSIFPEVKNFTRIRELVRNPFKIGNNQFYVEKGFVADSTFFSVFSFEAKIGDLSQSLNRKDLVVIDEYLAEKCFANENPIGRDIKIENQNYTVSAVIKNVPQNSHLQFHYLIPVLNLPEEWQKNKWGSDNCTQYLEFKGAIDKAAIENKLTQIAHSKNPIWKEYKIKLLLQPLKDIHFSTGYLLENAVVESLQNVYIFIFVAFLILLIACLNFTNMFISTSLKRIKSTGLKMASGASKLIIIKEFSAEVLLFVLTSFIISISLVKLVMPVFNNLFDIHLELYIFNLKFLLISVSIIAFTLLLAGISPGYFITRYKPVLILKAGFKGLSGKKNGFQNGLVTFQFVTATILIIAVIVIHKQVDFIKTKKLGFDKENIVYINTLGELNNRQNIKRLKDELIRNPGITGIAVQSCLPTLRENNGYIYTHENPEHKVHTEVVGISEGYFDVMKIQFIEGEHDFDYSNNRIESCIINESAAKQLNLKPPLVGQSIFDVNENKYIIIKGVINDINTKSLSLQVSPCLYTKATGYNDNGVILFKTAGNSETVINAIKKYCTKINSNVPFEYHFLDQTYDDLYKSEIRMQKVLSWFSVLSVLLTCMGLFAMVHFITENKIKEIGVRKVNGAKIFEVMAMLNKDFVKWVAIAFVIATPIAYYAMQKWLENFAYKTELSWWIFAMAGLLALGIALLTVSWKSWKAATRNPVEALRYE